MFEKLEVYQKAGNLSDDVVVLTTTFPRGFGFLADQLNRADVSIAAKRSALNWRIRGHETTTHEVFFEFCGDESTETAGA